MNDKVVYKIREHIIDLHVKSSLVEMPDKGPHEIAANYRLVTNARYPKYAFVVFEKLKYSGYKLDDKRLSILAFDINTGIRDEKFKETEVYHGFHNDLIEIQELP